MPKEGNTYRGVDLSAVKNEDFSTPTKSDWFSVGDDKIGTPIPVRLLPPVGQMGVVPWVRHVCHFALDGGGWEIEEGEQKRGITCLDAHSNEECPVCRVQRYAEGAGMEKLAKALLPRVSYYTNIYDREAKAFKRWNVKSSILKKAKMWFEQAGDFTNPEKGRDILVVKTGKAGNWKTYRYSETTLAFKETPLGVDDWLGQIADLTTMVRTMDAEDIWDVLVRTLRDQVPFAQIREEK